MREAIISSVRFKFLFNTGRSLFHFHVVITVYLMICFLDVNLKGEIKGSYTCCNFITQIHKITF